MQTFNRVDNFGAGPAVLPEPVLQEVQAELLEYQGAGMSVMEISHRSDWYNSIQADTETLLRELLGLSDDYEVLFLQGGASLQFAMLPMNFLGSGRTGAYILSGSWSEKAMQEAANVGSTRTAGSGKDDGYRSIPATWDSADTDAYVHLTSNNTIFGTQWQEFPDFVTVPLVADMSSDILSRRFPVDKFHMVYAGAQKNLGPAGVTLVILRKDWAASARANHLPKMLRYETHLKANSKYNTPPVFSVYVMGKVLHWIASRGGLEAVEQANGAKANLLYQVMDESDGFYAGYANKTSRSTMNVTFNLPTPELEQIFLAEAKTKGFVGLGGHRSVGGCRASIYNALPESACARLAEFMTGFCRARS